ncbi:MAG TPA: thiol-disulfide oxidoreductase DCC family protein [Saprospiraceae bacterium]|nr:thiol-disulfide oxidoreductase DCC family protein [Saprospiraceae bacterium]HMQ83815.1 thiol-disulfide oxidoreductase DCC family protein [Saprospiraceae bacterium]
MVTNTHSKAILLFDGVCNLCNGFVQFAIKHDPQGYYQFASLQSEAGRELLAAHHLPTHEISTVVLIEKGRVYTHSDVGLRMVRRFGGLWPLLTAFSIIPKPFRDGIYNWVARNRYRWFGQRESCMVPTPELKSRFLV